MAADLRAAGVDTGHGVGLRMANGPDHVVAMMAIWLAGAVLIPINDRLPEAGLAALLEATSPVVLVEPDGIRAIGSAPFLRPGRRVRDVDVGHDRGAKGDPAHPQRVSRASRSGPGTPPWRCGDATAHAPSPNLIPVSLALNAGMYNALFGLRAGAPLVIMDRFTTTEFARLVHEHAIRSTVLPPAAMAMLNDDPAARGPLPVALHPEYHGSAVARCRRGASSIVSASSCSTATVRRRWAR